MSGDEALDVCCPAVLAEVFEGHGHEYRTSLHGKRPLFTIAGPQMSGGAGVHLATGDREALRLDEQSRTNGYWLQVIGLEVHRDDRHSQQPGHCAEGLVERRSEQAPVRKTGSALMVLADGQLSMNAAAFSSGQPQMETTFVVRSASEALPVVTLEGGSWGWSVGVTLRRNRVLRRIHRTPRRRLVRSHVGTLPAR